MVGRSRKLGPRIFLEKYLKPNTADWQMDSEALNISAWILLLKEEFGRSLENLRGSTLTSYSVTEVCRYLIYRSNDCSSSHIIQLPKELFHVLEVRKHL